MSLLRGYLANFIKPGVITAATDIKTIDYHSRQNQLSDDALAIGTETLLEFEDEIQGTVMERNSSLVFLNIVTSVLLQITNFLPMTQNLLMALIIFGQQCLHRKQLQVILNSQALLLIPI